MKQNNLIGKKPLFQKLVNFYRSNNKLNKISLFIKTKTINKWKVDTQIKLFNRINCSDSENIKIEEINISRNKKATIHFRSYSYLYAFYREIFVQNDYYFKHKSKSPFIIDCGSNIGLTSIYLKNFYPDAKILAFEPSSKNFECLNKNIKSNNISGITAINKALYDKKSKILMHGDSEGICSISDQTIKNKNEYVETTLLSDYISQTVDLLKIDVEGSEYKIIEDLHNNKKLNFIEKIIMECHLNPENTNVSIGKVELMLKQLSKSKFNIKYPKEFKNNFYDFIENFNESTEDMLRLYTFMITAEKKCYL